MSSVITETDVPFNRFSGATASMTKLETLLIEGLMAVPIPIMASNGIP